MTRHQCLLGGCDKPAPTYTLCDFHREEHGISVFRDPARRRKERRRLAKEAYAREEKARKEAEQAEREARRQARMELLAKQQSTEPPRGIHRSNLPLTGDMILALHDALETRTSRQLRDEVGVSHDTIQRLSQATPGQRITERTYMNITEWMESP